MRMFIRSSVALGLLVGFTGACSDRQPTMPDDGPLLLTTADETLGLYDGSEPTPGGSHEVITTVTNGTVCRLTTFEGGGNFEDIHPELNFSIPGSNARFPGWKTLTSGNYFNNPSGVTIGLMTSFSHEITFESPVVSVSFFYASIPDVTLQAFDAAETLVATVTGSANAPPFSTWEALGVAVAQNVITRVTVSGQTFQTAIDDFENCGPPLTPEQQIQAILDEILANPDVNAGLAGSLASKLETVLAKLDKDNVGAAINQLQAFINQIQALIQAGTLAQPDGQILIDVAQGVIDQLSA